MDRMPKRFGIRFASGENAFFKTFYSGFQLHRLLWLLTEQMAVRTGIAILANFLLIIALITYGFRLFAEYHAKGRWAKNVTGLLAGIGLMTLALALLLTPRNAEVLVRIAETKAPIVLLWLSNVLLLAAIAAFGIITYAKPLRLWHERKIERDLHRELPKIP
jgi:hypothetical protein